jgi:hypothetical protein
MAEHHITRIAARYPEQLGYPGAVTVSGLVWGDAGGAADLVIFPARGRVRLAIVEVKRARADAFGGRNPQAHAHVVGQLLKYYARALALGTKGVRQVVGELKRRGRTHYRRLSLRQIIGAPTGADAAVVLAGGRPLRPEEIRLHVLINHSTAALERRLPRICRVPRRHHHLPIRVWYAVQRSREIRRIC